MLTAFSFSIETPLNNIKIAHITKHLQSDLSSQWLCFLRQAGIICSVFNTLVLNHHVLTVGSSTRISNCNSLFATLA
jgi:hypothetical protein